MSITQLPPGRSGIDDAVGSVIAAARLDLASLVDTPVWSLDDARVQDRLAETLALRAQVDELVARLVGQVEDRHLASTVGASSTRAWMMARHRMSAAEATRIVHTARGLGPDRHEPTRRAVAAGHLSAEQAGVITDGIARLTDLVDPVQVGSAQSTLIGQASRLTYTELRHAANHLVETVDPDGADAALGKLLQAEENRARAEASFVAQFGPDGTTRGRFRLPNASYAMLKKALDALASPRRDHLRTNPHPDHGPDHGPGPGRDTDPAQLPYATRMGQAFAELIEHLPTDAFPQHGAANCTLVVTIDETKLRTGLGEATLDTGGTLSVAETRRLACNATIMAMVLSGDSHILDLGRGQRLFTRPQRLALAHRDQGCIFPSCQRPPAWCHAHHLKAWTQHGPTNLDNGCLVCPFHHTLLHQGQWHAVMAPDGIIDIIPPTHIDPHQQPIRHERFKPRPG
jgi:hypothetical protein